MPAMTIRSQHPQVSIGCAGEQVAVPLRGRERPIPAWRPNSAQVSSPGGGNERFEVGAAGAISPVEFERARV